jgi:hypothetical protein
MLAHNEEEEEASYWKFYSFIFPSQKSCTYDCIVIDTSSNSNLLESQQKNNNKQTKHTT